MLMRPIISEPSQQARRFESKKSALVRCQCLHVCRLQAIKHSHCLSISLPAGERFVWHKLYASASRSGSPEKARKDLVQAATLAAILVEQDDASLAQSLAEAPPGVQKAARTRLVPMRKLLKAHPQALEAMEQALSSLAQLADDACRQVQPPRTVQKQTPRRGRAFGRSGPQRARPTCACAATASRVCRTPAPRSERSAAVHRLDAASSAQSNRQGAAQCGNAIAHACALDHAH